MAKGIKSKRMQKFKSIKRDTVKRTIEAERFAKLGIPQHTKKNAFLYPNDPEAVFPQRVPKMGIDFRSEAIAPFDTIVKSKKIFNQRIPYEAPVRILATVPEPEDLYMGELGASLKSIEKTFKKKHAMKID